MRLKILFFIFFFLLPLSIGAWNEDYPQEWFTTHRTVCIKNLGGILRGSAATVHSIQPDEPCPSDETRYTLVVGREPKGSYALVPNTSWFNLFPPWVVSWPSRDDSYPRLWHFTCFATYKKDVLGTPIEGRNYRGEITAPAKDQSCESASTMAREACRENLGGNQIFEQCDGGMEGFDFLE